jgi:hypothetical protein
VTRRPQLPRDVDPLSLGWAAYGVARFVKRPSVLAAGGLALRLYGTYRRGRRRSGGAR